MSMKPLPVRLDHELYDELREVAAAAGSTMVDIVREALREYLPRVAGYRAAEMEPRLARLRAIAARQDTMTIAIQATAQAEAELPDLLEEATVVEDLDLDARPSAKLATRKLRG